MLFPLPSSPALSTDTADTTRCLETMCSRTFSTRAHDHAQTLAPPPPILLLFCLMTTEPQPQLSKGLTSERLQTAQQLLADSRGRKVAEKARRARSAQDTCQLPKEGADSFLPLHDWHFHRSPTASDHPRAAAAAQHRRENYRSSCFPPLSLQSNFAA